MKKIIDKNTFGPWVLITGASSGIGEEYATQLASMGFNLVLVARREALLESIGRQLAKNHGISYRIIVADLSKEAAVQQIAKATEDLDIGLIISNAGTGKPDRFLSLDLDDINSTVQLNALSHLRLTYHFGKRLIERRKGGILLTGAMGAYDGVPYMASMAGSKALLLSLGRSLQHEFKEFGIRITVLVTSPTETPILRKLGFDKGKSPMKPISAEQCVTEALAALASGRTSVMPGRKYRIMNALIPGSLKRKMTGDLMKKNNGII